MRFDNGPEFVAHAVADWCRFNHTDSVFIDPSSPWQNAWIESFNGRLRDELLNGRQWDSLLEARVIIEDWRIDYNLNRPHTAHGDLSPARVRRRVVHQPTPSRTATGPTIGSPSTALEPTPLKEGQDSAAVDTARRPPSALWVRLCLQQLVRSLRDHELSLQLSDSLASGG